MIGAEVEGIVNDAVFTSLDAIDLIDLLFDGHILVNDADTAFTGNGNCHAGFGDGVHRGGHNGDIELDFLGQVGGDRHIARLHLAVCGNEQYVVECKTFFDKLCLLIGVQHTNNLPFIG